MLLLTIKFPLEWYHWRKQPTKVEGVEGREASKSRIFSFLLPFLYKRLENGHNLAILAPINLY